MDAEQQFESGETVEREKKGELIYPIRTLIFKKFFKEVASQNSIIKMECGEVGVEISEEKVSATCQKISESIIDEDESFVNCTFKGFLLETGKFEIVDELGVKIDGNINPDLSLEKLVEYYKKFLNKSCLAHLKIYLYNFKFGGEKNEYELLGLIEITN